MQQIITDAHATGNAVRKTAANNNNANTQKQ